MNSLITNVILNIMTNCLIDRVKFLFRYGGILTNSLPAVRRIFILKENKYTFLFHKSGKIILSNFNFNCDLEYLFSFIFSLIKDMINSEIAIALEKILKIDFLVENISCALKIDFCQNINKLKILQKQQGHNIRESLQIQRELKFSNIDLTSFLDDIRDMTNVKNVYLDDEKSKKFPASIIRIKFIRDDLNFDDYKSLPSKKRKLADLSLTKKLTRTEKIKIINENKKLFCIQNCCIELFPNGVTLISGAQTMPDLINIFNVILMLTSRLDEKNYEIN